MQPQVPVCLAASWGHIDTEGRFLDEILSEALRMGSSAFAGGYIAELLERHPSHSSRFNNWLDRIEIASPTLAHYLGLAAPVSSSPIERSLRLASAGQIDVNLLEHFQSGIFFSRMTPSQLCMLRDLLISDVCRCKHTYRDRLCWPLRSI